MSDGLTSYACRSLATPRNLGIIRRKYPRHCPYHVTHNILGGYFDRHVLCTVAPFSDGACLHGSHANPAQSAEAEGCRSQVAVGKTLQLPLGLSRRAGSTKLHDGCALCIQNDECDVACMSCGRAWVRSRRKGSRPVRADEAAYAANARLVLDAEGGGSWEHQQEGGAYQDGGDGQEENWGGGEEEEEQEEWWGEEDEQWDEEEEPEGEEGYGDDGESSESSSSGEEESPPKRARVDPGAPPAALPPPASRDAETLALKLEAALANARALEAELKLVKRERDDARKRAGD